MGNVVSVPVGFILIQRIVIFPVLFPNFHQLLETRVLVVVDFLVEALYVRRGKGKNVDQLVQHCVDDLIVHVRLVDFQSQIAEIEVDSPELGLFELSLIVFSNAASCTRYRISIEIEGNQKNNQIRSVVQFRIGILELFSGQVKGAIFASRGVAMPFVRELDIGHCSFVNEHILLDDLVCLLDVSLNV